MTNGHGIETPANKIATAQATLELAYRLNCEVTAGRITAEIFKRSVAIYTGGDGIRIPAFAEGSEQDLKDGVFNIVHIALYASALTVDETLNEVFGGASVDANPDRIGVRVMVHQLRNACAHNPWRPKWVIHGGYKHSYLVKLDDGSNFTFDATSLDGDDVKPEHVGGLEFWVKVLQHCGRLVSK